MFRTVYSLTFMMLLAGSASAQLYYPFTYAPGYHRVAWVNSFAHNYGFLMNDAQPFVIAPMGVMSGYPYMSLPYYSYLPPINQDPTVVPFNVGPYLSRDVFLSESVFAFSVAPYPASSAEPAPATGTANLTLTVPTDAEVLFQGQPTEQTGSVRTFVTPQLTGPGTYELKVKWTENGQPVEWPVSVNLKPGDRSSVMVLR